MELNQLLFKWICQFCLHSRGACAHSLAPLNLLAHAQILCHWCLSWVLRRTRSVRQKSKAMCTHDTEPFHIHSVSIQVSKETR